MTNQTDPLYDKILQLVEYHMGIDAQDSGTHIPALEAAKAINAEIAKAEQRAEAKGRLEMALEFCQQLDMANVPQDVKIPELFTHERGMVSVPIVNGEYWVNVHKALHHIRQSVITEVEGKNE